MSTTSLNPIQRAGIGLALASLVAGGTVMVSPPEPASAAPGLSKTTCKNSSKLSSYFYNGAKKTSKRGTGVKISNSYVVKAYEKCSRKQLKAAKKYSQIKTFKAKVKLKHHPTKVKRISYNKWNASYHKLSRAYSLI